MLNRHQAIETLFHDINIIALARSISIPSLLYMFALTRILTKDIFYHHKRPKDDVVL